MQENDNKEKLLFGIKGAPGICIGKAYLVDKGVSVLPKFAIPKKKLGAEKKRFKAAVKKATDELHQIIEDTPQELREHAQILETHADPPMNRAKLRLASECRDMCVSDDVPALQLGYRERHFAPVCGSQRSPNQDVDLLRDETDGPIHARHVHTRRV